MLNPFLSEIMHKNHEDDMVSIESVQNKISLLKNSLHTSKDAANNASNNEELLIATIYQKYEATLKIYNAVDFDDLIFLPVILLKQTKTMLEYWQKRVRYLLVDEYQDTNQSQYELIKLLTGLNTRFTLVGDDDQSIYAWRGARPQNMLDLSNDYPGLEIVKLEQNYRSTVRILRAANTLIENNPHIFTKKLWSDFGLGNEIKVIMCKNEDTEAERVATEILVHRLRHGNRLNEYAILYRSNHQARLIELKLQEHQISYNINSGISFFSRTEIKDLLAYLKLLVNPDDNNAFVRIVNTPKREIGTSTLEKLSIYANNKKLSLYDAASSFELQKTLDKRKFEKLQNFIEMFDKIQEICEREGPEKAVKTLIDTIEYNSWLHSINNPRAAERKIANVEFLLSSISRIIEKNDEIDSGPELLKETVFKLTLQDILERKESEEDFDRVQLLTLHSSKGLEFPYVYILGMEEGILPHKNSLLENDVQEERRLAYVGITRAQRELTLTMAKERKQFGEKNQTTLSRFVEELPRDDIIFDGAEEKNHRK